MRTTSMLLAFVVLASCGEAPPSSGTGIAWETDYQKGMALAKRDGKPIMLYFSADW